METPESYRFLARLLLSRCGLSGNNQRTDIDWARVYRIAKEHDIVPLIYAALRTIDVNVSCDQLAPFKDKYLINRDRNLILREEFLLLIKELRREGIEVIPYKEPLSFSLQHSDIAVRQFKDIDFLVDARDLESLYAVLSSLGYRLEQPQRWFRNPCYERVAKDYSFVRTTARTTGRRVPDPRARSRKKFGWVIIEPHWSIAHSRLGVDLSLVDLRQRLTVSSYHGQPVNLLSREDAHLVTCIVGSKSEWRSLRLIADVAASVEISPQLDWELCLERARKARVLRMFLLGNLLAAKLAGAQVPKRVQNLATCDPSVAAVSVDIQREILNRSFAQRVDPGRPSICMLLLRENRRDQIRYLFSALTTPRASDLLLLPLPGKLYFLYWFIVPVTEYVLRPLVRWLRNPRLEKVAADYDRRCGA